TYEYDAVGNLIKRIDRKRQEMDYRYDSLNCLISKTWAGANPPYSVTYTYDLASRLTQVTDPTGTYTFTSDNTGRFTATTVQYTPPLPTRSYTINYVYDAADNRRVMIDPERGEIDYGYDALNRLRAIKDFNQNLFTFNYDDVGRRIQLQRPNQVNTSYSYDDLDRLLSVLHQVNGGATIDGATYTLDAVGNRKTSLDQ